MIQAVYQYLAQFIELSTVELELINNEFSIIKCKPKQKLVNIGEQEHYLYFVVEGLLRKFFFRGKEEVVAQIAQKNDLLTAASSFFTNTPSNYVVEAIEASTLLAITKESLEKLYSLNYKFERLGRLVTMQWMIQKEMGESMRLRLTPKQRFLEFAQHNPGLMQSVPQIYLASYLDIKPETFSRYKHLLVKAIQ